MFRHPSVNFASCSNGLQSRWSVLRGLLPTAANLEEACSSSCKYGSVRGGLVTAILPRRSVRFEEVRMLTHGGSEGMSAASWQVQFGLELESIAEAADRGQVLRIVRLALNSLAKTPHVHIHSPWADVILLSPNFFQ
jgi:hypothetical protein